jgi:hypothetical protein
MIRARHEEVGGHTYWVVNEPPLRGVTRGHPVHLLPIYDEYLVAYRDRDAVPHGPAVIASSALGPVNFQHAVVIAGQVEGTWRVTRHVRETAVDIVAFRRLTSTDRRLLGVVARRYERFLAAPIRLSIG